MLYLCFELVYGMKKRKPETFDVPEQNQDIRNNGNQFVLVFFFVLEMPFMMIM